MPEIEFEKYVEIYRIVEWRDGAIFKTERIGYEWVTSGVDPPSGYIFAAPSSDYTGPTIRRKGVSH